MWNVRRERERPVVWGRRRQDGAEAPEQGRTRNPRIRRWIGAARRRALRLQREETAASAQVITLTWAQTFGRPSAPREETAAPARSQTVVLLRRG